MFIKTKKLDIFLVYIMVSPYFKFIANVKFKNLPWFWESDDVFILYTFSSPLTFNFYQ